jgi:two-component system, NarL family, nitrate/nitrite response regulator NarL
VIAVAVRLYREGLASTLRASDRLMVQAVAGTSLETHLAVARCQPDVAIVDVSLDDVVTLMRRLKAECSRTRILAFAVREEIAAILDYAEAGADGFVTANGSIAELNEAIERTAAGELLCSPRIAAQLLRRAAHHGGLNPVDPLRSRLTSREQQVLGLIQQGQSNKEIGSALNIAEATVKNHVHRVLEKLHVATRAQAMAAGAFPLKARLDPTSSSRRIS